MGKQREFGGQLEILVASEIYKRPVLIYNRSSKSFISENVSSSNESPFVLWYDFAAQHYEVLRPEPDISCQRRRYDEWAHVPLPQRQQQRQQQQQQ